jgi:hypothetical protein
VKRRYVIFGIAALVLLVAAPLAAKGPTDRIILTGPELESEMILTNPEIVLRLSMGNLEDFRTGIIEEPADPGTVYYELERQYELRAGEFQTFDRVRYYPGARRQTGYVFYVGIENGWSDYDGKWFHATAEAAVTFDTLFDPQAQPYVALLQDTGAVHFVDPVTLADVVQLSLLDDVLPLSHFVDSPDTQTFYLRSDLAGFAQHYRVNLADGTICLVDTLPQSAAQASGALWVAGLMAQEKSRALAGTWLEPIDTLSSGRVLLHHPLGRYHNYDYGAEDRGEIPGGVLVMSQNGGRLVDHWQPDIGFAQVIAGDHHLYGLHAPRGDTLTELYVLEAHSGEILGSRTLPDSRWSLGFGVLNLTATPSGSEMTLEHTCRLHSWELPQLFRFTLQALNTGT